MADAATLPRPALLRRATQLTLLTVGWNVVEGVVSVTAALASGSVALLGFGVDSFVESLSGGIMLWRLGAECGGRARSHAEVQRLDARARRLIGLSLFGLAGWVAWDASGALLRQEAPDASPAGIAITLLSLSLMVWLARAKRRTARALGSRAMEADAFQTTACWWLSLVTLTGLLLNAGFGLWWADPLAALGMTYFLVKEGREAWRGEECCG